MLCLPVESHSIVYEVFLPKPNLNLIQPLAHNYQIILSLFKWVHCNIYLKDKLGKFEREILKRCASPNGTRASESGLIK